jgi:Tfp pilus assembly protein PilF
LVYYRFKPIEHNLTSEWDFLYNKAHNEYLNYAATSGFVGLGTYVLVILVYLWWWTRYIIKQPTTPVVTLIITMGIAWISILVTNFFGFSVVVTSLLFWLIPAVSLLLGKSTSISYFFINLTAAQSKVVMGILCLFGLYFAFSVSTYWLADYYYAKGVAASEQDKYETAYEMLSQAIALRPEEPAYLNEISETLSVLAYAYDEQNDATMSGALTQQAIIATNKALDISPLNVSFWKGRTRVFYNLSQINPIYLDQALQSIETAQALAPTDPKVAYNRAILLNNTEKKDDAIKVLEQAIKMKPNYRDAAYALAIFYEEDKNIDKRNEWLNYILENINPDDSEAIQKLEGK